MNRILTPHSSLENLKREAKRWLSALRNGDPHARVRLERATPGAPESPTLRDVQLALAREHGFAGWKDLKHEVARIESAGGNGDPRQRAIWELYDAASQGNLARVAELLDSNPDIIDERIPRPGEGNARTALHCGIRHAEVVRMLLGRGANPNIRDIRDPVTGEGDDALPLHFAAEAGDLEIVRMLVESGADTVGEGTMHELNVLGWAVCWDYVHNADVAEYLLEHGAQHTIHTAVALGDVDAIRHVAAGSPADVDKPMDRTNHHRRPLHLAVIKKQPAAAAALIDLGADTNGEDAAGLTALDYAAMNDEREIADLLLSRGAEMRLPTAIFLGREADVERLLRENPHALEPGQRWGTLIVHASARGSREIIERLIRAGADVNVHDDTRTSVDQTEGYTPLHAAAWTGNLEAAAALLEHGADPNVRERKYVSTPAGWAAYAGREAVWRLILTARLDLFQLVQFDLAERIAGTVQQSPWELNRSFRELAPWEPPGEEWRPEPWHTPLAFAVARNKADAVRVLLEQGAAQVVSPDGRTLLDIAREAGHDEVAALLLQYRRVDSTQEGTAKEEEG